MNDLPIIYNVVCRACFRSPDGQRFDMPVCFAVVDTTDKDLNDQNLFLAAVFNSLGIGGDDERKSETKDAELLCLEIITYSQDNTPYSEPSWMQKEHTYYFNNNELISRTQSDLVNLRKHKVQGMIKNTYSDKSRFNLYMSLSPKGWFKYDSLQSIRKDKRIKDAQIFTYNRYMQMIEAGYKVGEQFYGTPFKTVTKLTLKEKLVSLERNHVFGKYTHAYSTPAQAIYGIMLGLMISTKLFKGQVTIADLHGELHTVVAKMNADHKLWRWFVLFSTLIYAYIAYLIFR